MGENFTPDELLAVQAILNSPDRDNFWLDYYVEPANREYYLVSGYIVYDPRQSDPIAVVKTNLNNTLLRLRQLDTGIDDSVLIHGAWANNVERIELSLNISMAVMDEDGVFTVQEKVDSLPPTVDITRWGFVDGLINTPRDTGTSVIWTPENHTAPDFSGGVTGTLDSTTVPQAGSGNNYMWLRINDAGRFETLALNIMGGGSITMNQFNDNTWVSNLSGTSIDVLKSSGGTITVESVIQHWQGIRSQAKW